MAAVVRMGCGRESTELDKYRDRMCVLETCQLALPEELRNKLAALDDA
jgi:hypothetical protein